MKRTEEKIPLVVNSKFGVCVAVIGGAMCSGLVFGIGRNCGEIKGIHETNNLWTKGVNEALKDKKYQEEISEKE